MCGLLEMELGLAILSGESGQSVSEFDKNTVTILVQKWGVCNFPGGTKICCNNLYNGGTKNLLQK